MRKERVSTAQEFTREDQGDAPGTTDLLEAFQRRGLPTVSGGDHVLERTYRSAREEEIRTLEEKIGSLRPLFVSDVEESAAAEAQHAADEAKDYVRACKQRERELRTISRDSAGQVESARASEEEALQYYVGTLTEEDAGYPYALLQVYPFTERRKEWERYERAQREQIYAAQKQVEAAEQALMEAKQLYQAKLQPALDRWFEAKQKMNDERRVLEKESEKGIVSKSESGEVWTESDYAFVELRRTEREQLRADVSALFHAEHVLHRVEACQTDVVLPDPPIDDLQDVVDIFKDSLETQQGEMLVVALETALGALDAVYPLDALKAWATHDHYLNDPRVKAYAGEAKRLKDASTEKWRYANEIKERLLESGLHYRDVDKHPEYLAAEKEEERADEAVRQLVQPPIFKELQNLSQNVRHLLDQVERRPLDRLRLKPFERMLEHAREIRDRLLVGEERKEYAFERTVDAIVFEASSDDLYTCFQTEQKKFPEALQKELMQDLKSEWGYAASYSHHGDNTLFFLCGMGQDGEDTGRANLGESLALQVANKRPRPILLNKIDPASFLTLESHHDLAAIAGSELVHLFSRDAHIGAEDGQTARAFFEGYGVEMRADPGFISAVEAVARRMQQIQNPVAKGAIGAAGKEKLTREDLLILDELLKEKDEDLVGLYGYAMVSRQDIGTVVDPANDLIQVRQLRACGLSCKKEYGPFLGPGFSPAYDVRGLLGQPAEIQERWAHALARAGETHLEEDLRFGYASEKIVYRALSIQDLASRVAWVETALDVQAEGGQEAVMAYACLDFSDYAEAKSRALTLVKEQRITPEGTKMLGTINWVRLMASADSAEERQEVQEAFQRLKGLQSMEDGAPFSLGLVALDAKTFLAVDHAIQEGVSGAMEGYGLLAKSMDIKFYPQNKRYREDRVVNDRFMHPSSRERVRIATELLAEKKHGVFVVFCELYQLAPGEARTLAETVARDWSSQEASDLGTIIKHFGFAERMIESFTDHGDVSKEQGILERLRVLLKDVSVDAITTLDIETIEKLLRESQGDQLIGTFRILLKLTQAPSASIQRIRLELAREIAASPEPDLVYERIVDIFVRNNLPLVGKVFRVFEALHRPEELDRQLNSSIPSPTLRATGSRGCLSLLYKDLVRTHLASGNRELLRYLIVMSELDSVERCTSVANVQALSEVEQRTWMQLVKKTATLLDHVTATMKRDGQTVPLGADTSIEEVFEEYQALREGLSLQPGQSIRGRLEEMFLRPIGLRSIEEAIAFSERKKHEADARNRALVADAQDHHLTIQAGDMLKGFDHSYFANILQNGSVAKEFLGASADSDRTPLDTDLSVVTEEDAVGGFLQAIRASIASGYGQVLFCVRPKETFHLTSTTDDPATLRTRARARTAEQIEYFKTGVLGERHMGIRTGFPLTEVDFVILRSETENGKVLRNLSMDSVINGYYIPIVDEQGKVLFTPQEYDLYRERFCSGILSLNQPPFEVHTAEPLAGTLSLIRDEIKENQALLDEGRTHITETVRTILSELGVLSPDQEFLCEDTGSSGRGTGVPGSVDFDFVLKLDPVANKKQTRIHEQIAAQLGGTRGEGDTTGQLRLTDVPFKGTKIDVDIAFVPQAEVRLFESHDAVGERLRSIRATSGKEAYEQVQATIVYAKRLLKNAGVYKKVDQGGFGGLGVENWILANHGNFIEAAQSFLAAAKPDGKSAVSLETFQRTYALIDPGANAKFGGTHDNFTKNLTQKGYEGMIGALEIELGRLK